MTTKTNALYEIYLFTINRDTGYDINTGEFNQQLVSNYQKILEGGRVDKKHKSFKLHLANNKVKKATYF